MNGFMCGRMNGTLSVLIILRVSLRFYPDVLSVSVSLKESCDKWEEPQHFNTRLDQCVDISVTPSNMSVTSPATQNVPELSGGVTCVFEALTETPGQVQAKGQVVCMSPSLKDLPAHTPPYGE
ncbi:Plexin A3 [Goodea atripinnis]|uniref:Plexin A3 n=1 Tax=Goodea atripinnis TaxID=208336 RepID=A0ABV0PSA7_9TELE